MNTIPQNSNHSEINKCSFLRHEESIYGFISYCDQHSWGKNCPCSEEIKDRCLKEHHRLV
ncbi:hypothetical protein H0A61_02090 [Koleobacter methoxysyntrophicus]|uniref:Uncharacterized protein n=1 Tax=Koleobacter methoxysyntrophicus TaxID=2751313 RepID=A0A8A0RMS7_9FIRM|nr:hypothetical protein [Thermosediminibacterales bacterium]MDK2902021.1 hypothetical protein [Thermosediminibacterales bacterium]QSQ09711.1 hypothetical protein H0A61_02090 [Koleobacter methoxysyntrophicus]